jgi:Zn-dependent protease
MDHLDLGYLLRILPGIIVGLTVHEFAHAATALKLGDDTAKQFGRYTLNPLRHIDPLGFLFIIVAGFGWAKPVLVDRSKLSRPRLGDALISAAGPLSNLGVSILAVIVLKVLLTVAPFNGEGIYGYVLNMLLATVYINLGLFVFNAIPLPPLDGSHLLLSALNIRDTINVGVLFRYGTLALFGIIIAEQVLNVDILPIGKAVDFLADFLLGIFGMGV